MLGAIVQPGNTGFGTVLCNTYQSRTLLFLNDIRNDEDRGWWLNGLDYAPVQAFVLLMASIFVLVNVTIDVLYGIADPRVSVA